MLGSAEGIARVSAVLPLPSRLVPGRSCLGRVVFRCDRRPPPPHAGCGGVRDNFAGGMIHESINDHDGSRSRPPAANRPLLNLSLYTRRLFSLFWQLSNELKCCAGNHDHVYKKEWNSYSGKSVRLRKKVATNDSKR